MRKLLIVESPAKIKTISRFLGKDFKILSTLGHIKDLPAKKLGVLINSEIKIDYEVLEGKEKTIAEIKKEAKNSDEIFLGPDPDREGEVIAWHVEQEIFKVIKDKNRIHRITFNEITKSAIEEALAKPSQIDENKVSAQQARRVLDRLVGYQVSPILWKKIAKGLSAGRVQSVALKLIVDREEEINNFKPEEYWTVESLFKGENDVKILASLVKINKKKPLLDSKDKVEKVVLDCKSHDYIVTDIKDTNRLKNPYPPFMTSTLQQAAYNQLGFSVQKTMQIAQKLYEGVVLDDPNAPIALITYMRTDSLRIADSALKQVRDNILKNYSKEYLPSKAIIYLKSKGQVQDAHEAIRPIDVKITPEYVKKYLSADQANLYGLIWKRFVASQMKPAQYAQRQVTIEGGHFVFKVTGSTLIFDGFLKVYNDSDDLDEKINSSENNNLSEQKINIPAQLKKNMKLKISQVTPKQHFTQPPPRYTEASLVKELEKEGIGRPSTYATIIKTIQQRAYTNIEKKKFIPTELGIAVTKMLTQNLSKIMDLKFTANMEKDLDKIANGQINRDSVIKDFYNDFEKELENFKGKDSEKVAQRTGIDCPKCKHGELVIRFGKTGPFLGCSNYPECSFTSNFERLEDGTIKIIESEATLLEEKCPKCKHNLRQIMGKYGKFVSCSNYPKCSYVEQVKAGFKCQLCKTGDIIQRISKGSKFWGCSNYPKCKFIASAEIVDQKCQKCNWPFILKKTNKSGQSYLYCANKECK